jgi:hypothetical protein
MLCITGGPNDVYHPGVDPSYASIATTSHTVVSVLYDVPNQTLTFTNDAHGPRGEDGIIAYTWKRYLETGDATWLARLPMTKAAVRYSFAKSCRQLKCATKTALAMALSSRIYLNPAWIQAQPSSDLAENVGSPQNHLQQSVIHAVQLMQERVRSLVQKTAQRLWIGEVRQPGQVLEGTVKT